MPSTATQILPDDIRRCQLQVGNPRLTSRNYSGGYETRGILCDPCEASPLHTTELRHFLPHHRRLPTLWIGETATMDVPDQTLASAWNDALKQLADTVVIAEFEAACRVIKAAHTLAILQSPECTWAIITIMAASGPTRPAYSEVDHPSASVVAPLFEARTVARIALEHIRDQPLFNIFHVTGSRKGPFFNILAKEETGDFEIDSAHQRAAMIQDAIQTLRTSQVRRPVHHAIDKLLSTCGIMGTRS